MNKTIKIYLGILIGVFILIIFIEFSAVKPLNWKETYNEKHKIPFGTYVLYNEFESLFPESKVHDISITPYEYFDDYYNWEDSTYLTTGTYINIDKYINIDEVSAQELLDFASHGNSIFISSNYIPQKLKDTLKLETENIYNFKGKADFSFANIRFSRDSITIDKGINNVYFSKLNDTTTTVLGYQTFNEEKYINYVKINHVNGQIFLHLQPVAFTNYNILKRDNKKYVQSALAYLPDDTIYFDSKSKKVTKLGNSKLRFILSQPALRYAWYLALLAIPVFMIFNAKRKQRIVKVIKPLENTTVAFTKTIGNLYYETKDHDNLVSKKITYFLEYLRRVYYLDTQYLDDKFIKTLSQKSGKDIEDVKKLIRSITYTRAKIDCSEDDLLRLSKQIEDFINV